MNLSVSVLILLFPAKSKLSSPCTRVLRVKEIKTLKLNLNSDILLLCHHVSHPLYVPVGTDVKGLHYDILHLCAFILGYMFLTDGYIMNMPCISKNCKTIRET